MQTLSNFIQKIVYSIIKDKFNIEVPEEKIIVSPPPKSNMGDVATSVAFVLEKKMDKSLAEIGDILKTALEEHPLIEEVVFLQGFLNIKLKAQFLIDSAYQNLTKDDSFSFEDKKTKINLEFISANPTGPLHIGHGRWAALGDSLARILNRLGYSVFREFYLNDAGVQIAKLKESVEALKNNQPIPEDGYHGEYLKDALNSDLEPQEFFLEQQKTLLENMGVMMDFFYSEKSLSQNDAVEKVIDTLYKKGFVYKKDGATWFASTKLDDDKDRPIIKSDGEYTYFAPDIAYHHTKIERGADWIIDILGADHHGYIKRINAAVHALSDGKTKFSVLLGQLVNLFKDGNPIRMSKRAGNVITLQEVVDEIGVSATRFMLVSKRYNQTINFDLNLVKEQNKDNPLFYIQYAFVRIHSILSKISPEDKKISENIKVENLEPSERILLMKALSYREELLKAGKEMEPYQISSYLFDLASFFHKFYEKVRIISDNEDIVSYRIIIVQLVSKIIEDGLSLIGIVLEKRM